HLAGRAHGWIENAAWLHDRDERPDQRRRAFGGTGGLSGPGRESAGHQRPVCGCDGGEGSAFVRHRRRKMRTASEPAHREKSYPSFTENMLFAAIVSSSPL